MQKTIAIIIFLTMVIWCVASLFVGVTAPHTGVAMVVLGAVGLPLSLVYLITEWGD